MAESNTPHIPAGAQQGNNRRTVTGLFVNRALIKRYMMIIISVSMVSALVISFVINGTIKQSLERQTLRVTRLSATDVLRDVNSDLLVRVFMVMFASVIITGAAGIAFLHSIAGPVYRFRGVIRSMANGKVPERDIKLREGDFFVEVAQELNRLMAYLRKKGL